MQNEIHYLLKQLMESNMKSGRRGIIQSYVSEAENTKSYVSVSKSTADLGQTRHL